MRCKITFIIGLVLAILFFGIIEVHAQKSFRFRQLQKADGLSSDDVLCITQDRLGYIWIGTQNGLNRYDGYQFKVFKNSTSDHNSLSNNWITSILEDSNGNLWVGTQGGGLNKYDRSKDEFVRFKHSETDSNSISTNEIWCLAEKDANSIWIGTQNGGLNLFDHKSNKFTVWKVNEADSASEFSNEIISVLPDGSDKLWIAAAGGGFFNFNYATNTFKRFDDIKFKGGQAGSRYVRHLSKGSNGAICIITSSTISSLYPRQDSVMVFKTGENGNVNIESRYLRVGFTDSRGSLWIGSKEKGLYRYVKETRSFANFEHSDRDPFSLCNNDVTALFEDKSGLIWVGSRGGGISILNYHDIAFEHWTHDPDNANSLIFKEVRAIKQLSNQDIWLGTNEGISCFSPKQEVFTNYIDKSVNSNSFRIRAFAAHKKGIIAGTEGVGLIQFDSISNKFVQHSIETLFLKGKSQYIRSLLVTDDSTLWCGSYDGGLIKLNSNTFEVKQHFLASNHPDSLSGGRVQVLYSRNQEEIWLGTNSGVNLFSTKTNKFKHWIKDENDSTSILDNKIRALFQDKEGMLWVGTRGGLSKLNPETGICENYTKDDGLPSEVVFAIYEDTKNQLWLSTPSGIAVFDKVNKSFRSIRVEQNNKFDMGAHFQCPDGRLIFGGKNGFVRFHPDSIYSNPYVPPVIFTGFLVDNKLFKFYDEVTDTYRVNLTYNQNDFSVSFSALDYTDPQKNMYAYFLSSASGVKRVELGNRHELSFSNLEPGSYTLRVIGSNNDGLWNEKGTSFSILISPPWWKTWWFKLVGTVFLITSAFSFFYYRLTAIKRQKEELERLVTLRTKELQEQKNEVVKQNEEIKQQSEEISSQRDNLEKKNIEIEQAYTSVQLLSKFGKQLTASLSMDEIHDMIYSYISSTLVVDSFGIGNYNPLRNVLSYNSFYKKGVRQEYVVRPIEPGLSFSSYAVVNKVDVFENDVEANWNKYFELKPDFKSDEIVRSVVILTLMSKGEVMGVLSAYSENSFAFSQKDFSFITNVASYVSIALSNANLYGQVNRKNEHINSSIQYAKQIQQSILPILSNVDRTESFVLFMPKDIVSGDFYTYANLAQTNSKRDAIFAVVDCTGHGVPGAFMSLIGSRILNQIINERQIIEPATILEQLNSILISALKQDQTENNDGMDVALCRITDTDEGVRVLYAGAKRPMYYVENGKLEMLEGTRKSIGGVRARKKDVAFEQKELLLAKGSSIYLSSDGYIDQNGDDKNRLGSKIFMNLLLDISSCSMQEQKIKLKNTIDTYMGNTPQRDDITVWGIRL